MNYRINQIRQSRIFLPLQKSILYDGVDREAIQKKFPGKSPRTLREGNVEGIYPSLFRKYAQKGGASKSLAAYFEHELCPTCHGERLHQKSRAVHVVGKRLPQLVSLSLKDLLQWITQIKESLEEQQIVHVEVYLHDLETKLNRLIKIGLGYLSLNRVSMTLSGGELQRIQLAAALDSELTGVLYILDEPTRGLHPQDTQGIVETIRTLRDKGNTVLIIEHDLAVLKECEHIVELGPGSGREGGKVIAEGTWQEILSNPQSMTAQYLKAQQPKPIKKKRLQQELLLEHANTFNLKDVCAKFYVGACNVVCGVSGSGKSTLIYEELAKRKHVKGLEQFDDIILIEQKTMTRMKRSNVATSTKLFDEIRKCYASLQEAKELGFSAGSFSFNSIGGRCEHCEGMGTITSNLLFFEDVEVPCPVCHGKQFHEDVLEVRLFGYDIHELLQLSVNELQPLFSNHAKISKGCTLLQDVGLGYVTLGQSLTTLSSGEAQRLKLAKELMEGKKKRRLYLIDEPTIGLHPIDIQHFMILLHRLSEQGNTSIVIEHDPQVIKEADWIVELGPQGGDEGGEIIAMGTVEDIRSTPSSIIAPYLTETSY